MEIGFILKKAVSAFMMPLSIGLLLLLLGIVLLYLEKNNKAKILLTVSFIWIGLFSHNQLSNFLLKPLESQYEPLTKIPEDVKHILLLGGDKYNRGWEALRVYNLIPNSKIITSGYAGSAHEPEALINAKMLIASGVKKEDIIIHSTPKDTKEEAVKIKEVLGNKPFILITSASHMPRAMAIFKKTGLNPIPSPTAYWYKENGTVFSMPDGSSLSNSEKAWHEYLGIIWGKLRGHI